VTLKVKYNDFKIITRSRSGHVAVAGKDELLRISHELLAGVFPLARPVRLLGVTLSGLGEETDDEAPQLTLL
jgi:DNA polymerase-4